MHVSKISGSLVRRIVLVFLLLVILPFLLYVGFLWNRDWKIKLDTAFSEMQLVGKFAKQALGLFYEDKLADLKILSTMTDEQKDESILAREDIDLLFRFDSNFVCNYSNIKNLEGRSDLFQTALGQVKKGKNLLFVANDPNTNSEALFLFHLAGENIWAIGVDLTKWKRPFANLQKIGYPVKLSFIRATDIVHQKNIIVWTSDQLATWQKNSGLFGALKLRGKNIGINELIPNAFFDIQTSLTGEAIHDYQGIGIFTHVFLLFMLLIVFFGAVAIWMIFRISKPFQQLFVVMQEVRRGNHERKYVSDPYGFEINDLGMHFNQMLADLLENQKIAENERVAKELVAKELEIGRVLQDELLPKEIPEFSGIDFGRGFIPAKELSGDFYDLLPLKGEELFMSIGDGSDKGISACLYSLVARSMLRSHAISKESLQDIVIHTNDLFCKDTKDSGNFVTAWLGIYNSETHQLEYSSAGHLPGIILHPDGKPQELTTSGIALGVNLIQTAEIQRTRVAPGSLLVLYSDGITEAHNEKGELFGKSRLIEFLQQKSNLSPQALIDLLLKEVKEFAKETAQHDDLTAVCLKMH